MTQPDGFAVERLAISMAAAVGFVWSELDMDQATRFRICANTALAHPFLIDAPIAPFAARLEEAAGAAEQAAGLMATWTGDNALEERLFRAAASLRQLGRVVGVLAPVEDPGDVI